MLVHHHTKDQIVRCRGVTRAGQHATIICEHTVHDSVVVIALRRIGNNSVRLLLDDDVTVGKAVQAYLCCKIKGQKRASVRYALILAE